MARPKTKVTIDLRDYRNAFGIGVMLGLLIAGLPHLLGGIILLGVFILVLKLVEKGRV